MVRKGETACNSNFSFSHHVSYPIWYLFSILNKFLKCSLQFVSIWTSLKFLSFYSGLIATFQLSSAASLNLGWSQNGVLRNGLTIGPLRNKSYSLSLRNLSFGKIFDSFILCKCIQKTSKCNVSYQCTK